MPLWEAAPPRAACRAAADARAHAFDDELCPVHRPATSCVARGSRAHFGVGLCRPNWRPAGSESSFEVAGAVDSSGRGVSTPERTTCWCSATTPLRPLRSVINRRDAAARKESVRQARTALIAWTERHNKCFTYLCFVATAINAAREALAIRHKRERHVRKHRAKRSQ